MLQAAIFDMDGVIIDSHPIHKRAWRRFLESVGRHVTEQDLEFVLDGHKREDILRHFLGDLQGVDLHAYGLRKDALFAEFSEELQLVDGVDEFIGLLLASGVRLGVATSASGTRTDCILRRFDLKHSFQAIVTGNDVAQGKPNPAVFQQACHRLNVHPGNALVIEDAVSGIRGARAAGTMCMGIASQGRERALYDAGAAYVVPNFKGLTVSKVHQFTTQAVLHHSSGS